MTAKEQVQELLREKGYFEVSFVEGTVLKSARKPFFHHRVDYEVIARHGESLHPGEWSLQVIGSSWQEVLDKLTKLFLIQEETPDEHVILTDHDRQGVTIKFKPAPTRPDPGVSERKTPINE